MKGDSKEIKVEKWDHNAVRIAVDDAAKKTILDLDYEENFKLIDTRLGISTIAVLFALFALAWDFFYPFPESKIVLLTCSLCYFVLMGIFTLHATFFEKTIFLVAHQKDPNGVDPDVVWTLSSIMARYDKNYTLNISVRDKSGERSASSTKCVGDLIDESGVLHEDVLSRVVMSLHDSIASGKKKQ